MASNTLYHYGVKGMKWGVRKKIEVTPRYGTRMIRGHAGPGVYFGKKRRLAGDKKDLDYLNKGGHLSVGVTKKRQAAFDARDKRIIENRIAKNEKVLAEEALKKIGKQRVVDIKPRYGARIVRGHAGPGVYIGKERRLAGDKRDLDYVNRGGHLSVGITKKRQAALDARDKRIIENRIAKNEEALKKKAGKKK